MFFKRRALQAEYFDEPGRPLEEIAQSYEMLASVNRFFVLTEPFQRVLPKLLGAERCRSLSMLDLGAGDGSLGHELADWAAKRGWNWRIINLDNNPVAMRLNNGQANIVASAVCLPFRDRSFDVVLASQMTHHLLSDVEVCQHFREAWRVTRDLVFMNDLHRNPGLYVALWLLLRMRRYPAHFRADGLLSVKRGWRVG
ncbi:MAG TPA: methyltransferase domain-containing protein, partial [Verrucomicrobiae bacterium]|nr:methyltransferase domain-containing protein [Verrucomicrobiae bacterium]